MIGIIFSKLQHSYMCQKEPLKDGKWHCPNSEEEQSVFDSTLEAHRKQMSSEFVSEL